MTVRVAAVQFSVDIDRGENLATCRRMIDAAAAEGAQLIVLPEFCNHPSWYEDDAHARAVAVAAGDEWLAGIADRARVHSAWVMVNATRAANDGAVYGSNFLYDPAGQLAAVSDKQVLMGGESLHISPSVTPSRVIDLPFGKAGLYSCMDGVIYETPRILALGGARVLCNSLNSFAADEATMHVPVRAAENGVFVVAANKVGPLIPAASVSEVAGKLGVPEDALVGAGESQVVAPDGRVLAIGPATGEAVVVADIDPALADDKRRPDGTDRIAARRPSVYAPIAAAPLGRRKPPGAEAVTVAVVQPDVDDDLRTMAEHVRVAAAGGAALVVLPELAGVASATVDDAAVAAAAGDRVIETLAGALAGTDAVAVTSRVVEAAAGWAHESIVVASTGLLATSRQIHAVARHDWVTALGDDVLTIETGFGRLAVVIGDDSTYPEVVRLAALQDADVVAVAFAAQESWETAIGLVERSAENRVCVVAATRPSELGTSLITTLQRDFTLWTQWEERSFDGTISQPVVTRAPNSPGVTSATIHPAAAANRILTRATDVVDSRPWRLAGPIVGAEA